MEDYSDLETIKNSIGGAEIVMLGEQDHGDGTTFLAKTRLVKFLNKMMGFDIIVFGSDFYGLYKINESEIKPSAEKIRENTFSIWSDCLECSNLYDYLEDTTNRLRAYGMDPRITLKYSNEHFFSNFQTFLSTIKNKERFNSILQRVLIKEYSDTPTDGDKTFIFQAIEAIQKKLKKETFDYQTLNTLAAFVDNAWNNNNATKGIRDRQMAENLIWLKQHFKGRKIIVWAHNVHIANNVTSFHIYYPESWSKEITTAGAEVKRYFGYDKVYIIGFDSYAGTTGWASKKNIRNIPPPENNSFEQWVKDTKTQYGFIDFKKLKDKNIKDSTFHMKALGHFSFKLPYLKIYDGIFYREYEPLLFA